MITKPVRFILFCVINLVIISSAWAWKPSTHVYLGIEALKEVNGTDTLIPIYTLNPNDNTRTLFGNYPANEGLVKILRANPDAFKMGMVGPDAYPDLPTGQTRIHIPCPDDVGELEQDKTCPGSLDVAVTANLWLKHIWDEALQFGKDDVKAFAFGYLAHAAGDMFMHTYVNYFAGGPFSSLSDNGVRHFLIESYVGKRTPALTTADYNVQMSAGVQSFIYEKLTYASAGSYLDTDLLIDVPVDTIDIDDLRSRGIFQLSLPRYFSTLKNNLDSRISDYDATIARFDQDIEIIKNSIDDCKTFAVDENDSNNCSFQRFLDLGLDLKAKEEQKALHFVSYIAPITYARAWSDDIARGLYAWPAFSHEISKSFIFSENGVDRVAMTAAWDTYKNEYFIKMLGVPDAFPNALAFINSVQDAIYTPKKRAWVQSQKDEFINGLIRFFTLNQLDRDKIEDFVTNPALYFPVFVSAGPSPFDDDSIASNATTTTALDLDMALKTDGTFDKENFAPAYNTITMLKLMLLSPEGITQLYRDLKCPLTSDCRPTANDYFFSAPKPTNTVIADPGAMFGFFRTLDGAFEWNNHSKKMWFGECDVYVRLFMKVLETDCGAAAEPLAAPDILSAVTTANAPIDITLAHNDPEASIYYTISAVNQPREPSNRPGTSGSILYTSPFTLYAPFTEVQPLVVRAKAFKDGFSSSVTKEVTFLITSSQSAPSFDPVPEIHIGSINVVLQADVGSLIYYTLNGETPTYLSQRYGVPIRLFPGEHTIKAIALRLGYPQSGVSEHFYKVYAFNNANVLPVPRFSPSGSATVVNSLTVEMFADAQNVAIHYTIADGVTPPNPSINDLLYTTPLTLGLGNYFIKAFIIDPNDPSRFSPMNQIRFTISPAVGTTAAPVFDPPAGTYFNSFKVFMTAVTIPENAGTPAIIFTREGTEPIANLFGPIAPMVKYNSFVNVPYTTILKAQAVQTGFTPSPITRAIYRLQVAKPFVDNPPGVYQDSVDILLDSITVFPRLYYTLDGTEPSENSTQFVVRNAVPITISASATLKVKGFMANYFDSETLTVNYIIKKPVAPVITQQPSSQVSYVGVDIQLKVVAIANPDGAYQWFKNESALVGQTQTELVLRNISLSDAGNYTVQVSNSVGSTISNIATLEVIALPAAPIITQFSQSQNLKVGDTINLVINVQEPSLVDGYQWYFNSQVMPSQTQATLSIAAVNLSHSGEYFVKVFNRGGVAMSDVISVTVIDAAIQIPVEMLPDNPIIVTQPQSRALLIGDSLQLSVTVKSTTLINYLWFRGDSALVLERSASLIIDRVKEKDLGDYFVLVSNETGSIVSSKASISLNAPANNNSGGGGLNAVIIYLLLMLGLYRRYSMANKSGRCFGNLTWHERSDNT